MTGKEIDNYRILEIIGKGGMGVVYKALDMDLETPVALKMIDPVFSMDQTFLRRFREEAKGLAKARHPNIVTVYRFLDRDDGLYIVMEFVDGQSLDEYFLEHWPVSWKDSVRIFREILKAMGHAHNVGVFHRDIKPRNIMITKDGFVKVMDFGLAKVQRHGPDSTITQAKHGTLKYMPPERIRLSPNINYKTSDIYSLGMTFYELLAGRTPFEETDTDWDIQEAIVRKKFLSPKKFNPDVQQGLAKIVMRAIEKAPEARYQTVNEMLSEIDNFQSTVQLKSKRKPADRKLYFTLFSIILVFIVAVGMFKQGMFDFLLPTKVPLTIKTSPVSATVFINNKSIGATPISSFEIKTGTVSLKVTQENYFPFDTTFVVQKDQPLYLMFDLIPAAYASIAVVPTDAEITLDGEKIDSMILNSLELLVGQHKIKISHVEYLPREEQFTLVHGENPTVNYRLERLQIEPGVGTLSITSVPAGVSVWLDDKYTGTTPLNDSEINSGSYRLLLKKRGFLELAKNITIREDKITILEETLAELAGSLKVTSKPAGAAIIIDGRNIGTTPQTVQNVKLGALTIQLHKKGYEPFSSSVSVRAGKTFKVTANLTPLTGRVRVLVRPFGSIYVDGILKKKDAFTPYTEALSVGAHKIRIVHSDLGIWEKAVQIKANEVSEIRINLNQQVKLTIVSHDPAGKNIWGKIFVDNQDSGQFTPKEITLSIGLHTIAVRRDGFILVGGEKVINVEENTEPLQFTLKRIQ